MGEEKCVLYTASFAGREAKRLRIEMVFFELGSAERPKLAKRHERLILLHKLFPRSADGKLAGSRRRELGRAHNLPPVVGAILVFALCYTHALGFAL